MVKGSQYQSVAQRLEQLKNNDLINEEEEYNTKRKEILADFSCL
jgi:hypothetical protein